MLHRVLLVDDEPNVLAGLRRALHKEPYDILCATSADEAFVLLQAKPADVVVSDQDMPSMTGTTFLTKVRQKFPDTVRFMLTGKGTLDVVVQAINQGAASEFFIKPCNTGDLIIALRQAFQQKDLLRKAKELLRNDSDQAAKLEQWIQSHPRIMRMQRDTARSVISAPEDILFSDILHQLRREAAKDIFFIGCWRRVFERATLHTMYDTSLTVHWEHSTLFLRKGEETLVFFDVPPQQRYILQTCMDEIHIDRFKLVYRPSLSAVTLRQAFQQKELLMEAKELLRLDYRQTAKLEQWVQSYPGAMQVKQDKASDSVSPAEEIPLSHILRQLRRKAKQKALVVSTESRIIIPVTLLMVQDTTLIVELQRARLLCKRGERLLVLFPVPPQEHYIVQAWVEEIYLDRLTLVCRDPDDQ